MFQEQLNVLSTISEELSLQAIKKYNHVFIVAFQKLSKDTTPLLFNSVPVNSELQQLIEVGARYIRSAYQVLNAAPAPSAFAQRQIWHPCVSSFLLIVAEFLNRIENSMKLRQQFRTKQNELLFIQTSTSGVLNLAQTWFRNLELDKGLSEKAGAHSIAQILVLLAAINFTSLYVDARVDLFALA